MTQLSAGAAPTSTFTGRDPHVSHWWPATGSQNVAVTEIALWNWKDFPIFKPHVQYNELLLAHGVHVQFVNVE